MKRLVSATLLALAANAAFVTPSARDLQQRPAGGVRTTPPALSREEIALAADRIRADRWYDDVLPPGAGQAMRQDRRADMDLLLLGLRQPAPSLRAAALRELGRFELAANAQLIAPFLLDPVDLVKRAAADALVQTLWDKSPADAAPVVEILDGLALQEINPGMMATLWNAIAELPIDVETAHKYETRFINEIRQATALRFSAQAALLILTQHRRGRPLMAETEEHVMELARQGLDQGDPNVLVGLTSYGSTIGYIEILQAAQADADDIAFGAASFFCRKTVPGCGADIRRLGVYLLNPSNPKHVPVLLQAARDRADVRTAAAAIRQLIKSPEVTRCSLLDLAQGTLAEPDVIAALAVDPPERKGECGDWSAESWLTQQASNLMSATRGTDWIAPVAALEALARRAFEAAEPIAIDVVKGHPLWQARVAAARVVGRVRDKELVLKVASDDHPNVRTALLETLRASESPHLIMIAIPALSDRDYQVVRTAALVLKGMQSQEAVTALFDALRRLTEQSRDTSRRARLALLERIEELLPGGAPDTPERLMALDGHLTDFDPLVAKAAAQLLQKSSTKPVEALPTYRPPQQPSALALRNLPPCVLISLEGEAYLTVVLNRNIAPVAVARFVAEVGSFYYNNSVIYRDDENVTVFGNRPAHDEGGWLRFARDEPGTPIQRLSLTMLNHGPDTADGRLAIRWHANPELDRRETVIGQAFPSQMALQAIQLGKHMEKIARGGEARIAPAGPSDPCYPRRPW